MASGSRSGKSTPVASRRASVASSRSAYGTTVNVPFSVVAHIDSKQSLRFMLNLRGGQEEWIKEGLNTRGHTDIARQVAYERPTSAPASRRRQPYTQTQTPSRTPGRQVQKPRTAFGAMDETTSAAASAAASPPPAASVVPPLKRGKRGKQEVRKAIIQVAPSIPKSRAPPPTGCKNPACVRINKWSWELEGENDRLRELISNSEHLIAQQRLTHNFDTQTAGVIDHLKKLVETRTKELKQLQDKYTAVAQTGDEMQKTLLNLHQEYSKLRKNMKELTTEHLGLKTRYNSLLADAGDKLAEKLAEPAPKKYEHNGTYGHTPLASVLADTDNTPARLLRQLGQDVLDGSSTGLNKAEMVWSCCLQADESAGCTIPSPSHVHDVARKRKDKKDRRTSGSSTQRQRSRRTRRSTGASSMRRTASYSAVSSSASVRNRSTASFSHHGNGSTWTLGASTADVASRGSASPPPGAGRVVRGGRGRATTPGWRHNRPPSNASPIVHTGQVSTSSIFEL